MTGHISQRSPGSWRIKYEAERDVTGKRKIVYATVKGTRKQAQAELIRLLAARNTGVSIEPDRVTIAEYMWSWVSTAEATSTISPKSSERYRGLIKYQIAPFLGTVPLQKLRAEHIARWHGELVKKGGHSAGPLSPRTVGHCHRLLHKALGDAARRELLIRKPMRLDFAAAGHGQGNADS